MSDDTNGHTLTSEIRQRWHEVYATESDFARDEVARDIADSYELSAEFCRQFALESWYPTVVRLGMAVGNELRSQRNERASETKVLTATEVADRIAIPDSNGRSRWAKWFEYDPISKRQVNILELTKEQGLAAAQHRRKQRLAPEQEAVGIIELAVGRLQPGQKIGDVWTEEELDDLAGRLIISRTKYTLGPPNAKRTIMDMIREDATHGPSAKPDVPAGNGDLRRGRKRDIHEVPGVAQVH